jgi:hypothetical protein
MVERNITIRFKEQRQAEQFVLIDPRLRGLLFDIAFFAGRRYGHILTVTGLLRTRAEQDEIYRNHIDPKKRAAYKRAPWPSVHQFGRGADVRIDFPVMWLKELMEYVNRRYPYDPARPELLTALVHNAGSGEHIHLQVMDGHNPKRA